MLIQFLSTPVGCYGISRSYDWAVYNYQPAGYTVSPVHAYILHTAP
jgi:hypothetical protein